MSSKNSGVAGIVEKAARPLAQELGLILWDVEFVKEGASYYLRIYIDKAPDKDNPNGGVGIDDCEAFHRRIDPIIDELDPIKQSYFLEVSSPGIERILKKPEHFSAMAGKTVNIQLFRADESGRKEFRGLLKGFRDGAVTIEQNGEEKTFVLKDAVFVKLSDDDFTGGID